MALNSGYNITGLTLLSGGSGYQNSTTFNLVANDIGLGSGFAGTATSNGSGVITSVSISSAGANYSSGSWAHQPDGSAITTIYNTGGAGTTFGSTTIYINSLPSGITDNSTVGFFDGDNNFQVVNYTGNVGGGPSRITGVSGYKRFINSSTTPSVPNGGDVFNVKRSSGGEPGSNTSISIVGGEGTGCLIVPTIGFSNSIDVDAIRTEKGEAQGNNDIHDLYQAFGSVARASKPNFDWYNDGPEFGNALEPHPIRFDEFFGATYDAYGGSGCFSVDTPITLPDGLTIPIEDLFVGQEVLSMEIPTMPLDFDDEDTWKEWETNNISGATQVTASVKEIYFDWYKNYYLLNDRIKTTYEHPFFVKRNVDSSSDKQYLFITTENLVVGDEFLTDTSGSLVFEEVTNIQKVDEELETVNINCEPHDVYFAGGVLVHNVHDK